MKKLGKKLTLMTETLEAYAGTCYCYSDCSANSAMSTANYYNSLYSQRYV